MLEQQVMQWESVATNLGISTDLLLHAQTGGVQQQDDCVLVRTPEAPEYYFGNVPVLARSIFRSKLERRTATKWQRQMRFSSGFFRFCCCTT